MAPLPSFTLTGNVLEILGSVVGGELETAALSQAQVELRPNAGDDIFVTWEDSLNRVLAVTAMINTDGDVVLDADDTPVRLLAQDDGLNIRNLRWQVRIHIPPRVIPPSPGGTMRSWWVSAPGDGGTLNIADSMPAPRAPIGSEPDTIDGTPIGEDTIDGGTV